MTTRKGAAKGSGSGYKNLRGFPKDPMVHAQAAKGMKQPQKVTGMVVISRFTKGKDMPVREVSEVIRALPAHDNKMVSLPNTKLDLGTIKKPTFTQAPTVKLEVSPVKEIEPDYLSKLAERQEKKPSKFVSALSIVGSAALASGRGALASYQQSQKQKAMARREEYIEELRDVEHPMIDKRDKIEARIDAVEDKIAAGVGDEDKHFDELATLKAELAEVEGKITSMDLTTFTDSQLKGLAVRHSDDDLFSIDSGNRYERELLRRIEYRKVLDKKMGEAQRAKTESNDGLFDF